MSASCTSELIIFSYMGTTPNYEGTNWELKKKKERRIEGDRDGEKNKTKSISEGYRHRELSIVRKKNSIIEKQDNSGPISRHSYGCILKQICLQESNFPKVKNLWNQMWNCLQDCPDFLLPGIYI